MLKNRTNTYIILCTAANRLRPRITLTVKNHQKFLWSCFSICSFLERSTKIMDMFILILVHDVNNRYKTEVRLNSLELYAGNFSKFDSDIGNT